jgi:cyclase
LGAGEILLNAIDRDGTRQGYDLEMVDEVARAVSVPVVACGGANNLDDLRTVLAAGASAAAAGSMFVYQGRHRAVLISYPSPAEIEGLIPGLSTSLNN